MTSQKDRFTIKVLRKALLIFLKVPVLTSVLNRLYNTFDIERKSRFHRLFHAIFRGNIGAAYQFIWDVELPQGVVRYSINKQNIKVRWEAAISVLGHDSEIKLTYQYLIETGVSCFFDIGANFGTHTFFFKAQGIRVVSFEPNPECLAEIRNVADGNGWTLELEECAVGNMKSQERLVFPVGRTWCGSLIKDLSADRENGPTMREIEVDVIKLDDFSRSNEVLPDLIKIDTEGYELQVLEGSVELIRQSKPKILFEANSSDEKRNLYEFFQQMDYDLYELPYTSERQVRLGLDEIAAYPGNNFLALSTS